MQHQNSGIYWTHKHTWVDIHLKMCKCTWISVFSGEMFADVAQSYFILLYTQTAVPGLQVDTRALTLYIYDTRSFSCFLFSFECPVWEEMFQNIANSITFTNSMSTLTIFIIRLTCSDKADLASLVLRRQETKTSWLTRCLGGSESWCFNVNCYRQLTDKLTLKMLKSHNSISTVWPCHFDW